MARSCRLRVLQVDEVPALLLTGEAGAFIFDSLDLFAFDPTAHRAAGRTFVLIAHYLPSMSRTGRDDLLLERERLALSQFDRWITTGEYATRYLSQLGLEHERIVYVPPPPPRYGALRHPSPPPLKVLMVANVLEQKGIRELLECLIEQVTEGDAFSVEIVGRLDVDPDYVAECLRLAALPGLTGRVRFNGVVAPDRMVDHYECANLFVSASKMETFGMALQEARAAGLPLLVFDGGNARQHVVDGAGVVVSSMTELATRLVELSRAPEQLRTMAARAERSRESNVVYDWDSAARALLSALTSAGTR